MRIKTGPLGTVLLFTTLHFGGDALAVLPAAAPLSAYDVLAKTISGTPGKPAPRNILELLPLLSPELRSNFTFIYDSRSPHGNAAAPALSSVDPLFPRVVLFTSDAKLMVAFTGNPDKPGFNTVETIRFDDNQAAFFTSRFVLSDAVVKDPSLAPLVPLNGKPNRPECTSCHGSDPRPIFDSYNVWPGFYGSLADEPGLNPAEFVNYKKFLAKQKNRADLPYGGLKWAKTSSVYPYMPSNGKAPRPLEKPEQLKQLPNTRLGMALTELNRARIARKLKQAEGFKRLRYPILFGLAGCSPLPLSDEFQKRSFDLTTLENEAKLRRAGIDPKSDLAKALEMQELNPELKRNLAEIFYLAGVLKISRSEWSMAFEPGAASFFDGILSGIVNGRSFYLKEDVILEMLGDLASEDKEFEPYFATYNPFEEAGFPFGNRLDLLKVVGNEELCKLIAKKASPEGVQTLPISEMSWLNGSAFALPEKTASSLPQPFRKCIRCHDPSVSAPANLSIPFGDLSVLPSALLNPSHSSGVSLYSEVLKRIEVGSNRPMPMGSPLEAEEREAIKSWISEHFPVSF